MKTWDFAWAFVFAFAFPFSSASIFSIFRRPPRLHPGEERGELVELLALPGVAGMVMALGALDLDARGRSGRPRPRSRPANPPRRSRRTAAPFSSVRPVAVMIAVAIWSQGLFAANCSASHFSNAG